MFALGLVAQSSTVPLVGADGWHAFGAFALPPHAQVAAALAASAAALAADTRCECSGSGGGGRRAVCDRCAQQQASGCLPALRRRRVVAPTRVVMEETARVASETRT